MMVLSLALYWAVSTGMWDAMQNKTPAEKNTPPHDAKTSPSLISSDLRRHLRRLRFYLLLFTPDPADTPLAEMEK